MYTFLFFSQSVHDETQHNGKDRCSVYVHLFTATIKHLLVHISDEQATSSSSVTTTTDTHTHTFVGDDHVGKLQQLQHGRSAYVVRIATQLIAYSATLHVRKLVSIAAQNQQHSFHSNPTLIVCTDFGCSDPPLNLSFDDNCKAFSIISNEQLNSSSSSKPVTHKKLAYNNVWTLAPMIAIALFVFVAAVTIVCTRRRKHKSANEMYTQCVYINIRLI